jgi:hypothetical protein
VMEGRSVIGDDSGNPELRIQDLQFLRDYSLWDSSARKGNYLRGKVALGAIFFVTKLLTLRATEPQGL